MRLFLLLVAAVTEFVFVLLVGFIRGNEESNKFALLGQSSDPLRCTRLLTKTKCRFEGFARADECKLPIYAYAAIKNWKPFRRVLSWRSSQTHDRWIHPTLANWTIWPRAISQCVSHVAHFHRAKYISVDR
jgi:hypothetical protein